MKHALLYIHGKGGSAAEADSFADCCDGYELIGVDYDIYTPWETPQLIAPPLQRSLPNTRRSAFCFKQHWGLLYHAGPVRLPVQKALFISPVLDMEKLIQTMMGWAQVTEQELCERGEIPTDFGETLSMRYLNYVRQHPVRWEIPTEILYGELDNMTSPETVAEFVRAHHASLTVMPGGEHWFHTPEQVAFLKEWLRQALR